MQNAIITIIGVSLITAFSIEFAAAAQHRLVRVKHQPAQLTEQVRRANNAMMPAFTGGESQYLSDYSEGHVISAPAGH